MSLLIYYQSFI
jgi:hypothetical protein